MADMQSLSKIWSSVLDVYQKETDTSDTSRDLWFQSAKLTMLTETAAVLVCENNFKRDIVRLRFRENLEKAFSSVLGFPVELDVRSAESAQETHISAPPPENHEVIASFIGDAQTNAQPKTPPDDEPNYYSTADPVSGSPDSSKRNTEYTFDTFIVGNSNKFAHAACKAVAANPAREYNPLFIYGPSGLGKTHLLYAITNEIRKTHPKMTIVYVKGEEFTNQMIDSISRSNTRAFRDRYRKADVLLIDDIQFIAGREATQEEFFHTFNELYESHKQIILASDRPPHEIKSLEERLETRFEWGLIADIKPPDFELRTAILKMKGESLHINIPDAVLNYIAENLKNNVRQLEGAVRKIGAQSFLAGEPITVDLAKTCIADLITPSEPIHVTVDKILASVSRHYSISIDDLKGKKRTLPIAMARHVSIYIIRTMTEMSLPAIGKVFSRDHTTIINSLEKVESEVQTNPALEIEIKNLIKEIKE